MPINYNYVHMYIRTYIGFILLRRAANSNKEWCDGFSWVVDMFSSKLLLQTDQTQTWIYLIIFKIYLCIFFLLKSSFERESIAKIGHVTALKLLLYKLIFLLLVIFLNFWFNKPQIWTRFWYIVKFRLIELLVFFSS